jgi:hypothetical protein
MRRLRATLTAMVVAVAALAIPQVTSAADPIPPFIPPTSDWLTTVNYFRAMTGMPAVVEDPTLSSGAYNHSCYMLYNGITHYETAGLTGYTATGDTAGRQGNVAVSSAYGTSARSHIELWMTGPFHALGIIRPNLRSVGFGKCDLNTTPTWHSGATLNVIAGLDGSAARPSWPVTFPGAGTTTSLSKFVTESPNPLTFCGWTGTAGLPVISMMPEKVTSVSASMTGPNGPLEVCALFAGNTTGDASAILAADNAVTVVPRAQLTPGVYTTTITTNARTVTWSFTVDPTAATGIMPMPTVSPVAGPSSFTAVTPFRFADSRITLRSTKITGNVPKRVQIAGVAGIPADATGFSANITTTEETGVGYLTVYNCTDAPPTASTLNFYPYEPVGNAGMFPLGPSGEICLFASKDANVIIDVTGYLRPSADLRYEGLAPVTLVDTTRGLGFWARMAQGQTITVNAPSAGIGVPSGATAIAVNITGIWPNANGYITAYECGTERPFVANVNPTVGATKQNFAIVPLDGDGSMCLYTHQGMDVKVDVLGYFMPNAAHTMVPTTPTRVADTRDVYRTEMNLGTSGTPLPAYQTKTIQLAGQRGIPANATVVSVNVAVVAPGSVGSLTMWGCGTQPAIQSVNYAGRTVANGIQVQLSADGALCVQTTTATHLIIDVTGWWT